MQKWLFDTYHSKILGENLLIYTDRFKKPTSLPTEKVCGLHYHNRCEIGLCKSGNGIWVMSDKSYAVSPGDVVINPAGVPHYSRSIPTADAPVCICEFIYFDEKRLLGECGIKSDFFLCDGTLSSPVVLTEHSHNNLRKLLEKMVVTIREMEKSEFAYKICAHWYALFLLELKISNCTPEPSLHVKNDSLIPAIQKIIVDFGENITLKMLADTCLLSTGYFLHSFKRIYGVSPIRYLNRFRAGIAAQLLAESNISITDICNFVGFSSPSDLYRHFTAVYGMSPSDYRAHRIGRK